MFALLPDLSPRDSHSLWYTSSRNPFSSNGIAQDDQSQNHTNGTSHGNHHQGAHHRRAAHLIDRSPLARLRADEQNIERRRLNVTDFGCAWLKPPGLPKTLHQLREERREAEEHQEALRREQLAQELAEAEAEAAAGVGDEVAGPGAEAMLDDGMDDVQLDGARDLDDEIPEADDAGFGLSGDEDEDEEDDEEDDDEDDEDGGGDLRGDGEAREMRAAHAQQQQLMAQRMRQAEDLSRGRDSAGFYGADEEVDDEDQSQMIEEEDLVGGAGDDLGMDADLDDEIPEAESMGGYEHTDTEIDVSSGSTTEEDDERNQSRISFAQHQQQQQQRSGRFRHSLARSDATRNSIAISDILSRDGSSYLDLDSSPAAPRQMGSRSVRRGRG
ncbi:Apc15p protein-domain-containing protein [Xylaria intraflava]|nr:Apc15p protein-domain-containing protein [Xylaria intraflava]